MAIKNNDADLKIMIQVDNDTQGSTWDCLSPESSDIFLKLPKNFNQEIDMIKDRKH